MRNSVHGRRTTDNSRSASHRRQQLVAAIIGVELSATLPADRGAARVRRGIGRHAERTAQGIGGLSCFAGGEFRARNAKAAYEQRGGENIDRQSHGAVLPKTIAAFGVLYHQNNRSGSRRVGPVLA